jgi:hypothetical protein
LPAHAKTSGCFAAAPGSRRTYAAEKFTPEQVRQDEKIVWKTAKPFYGDKRRLVRYKDVFQALWQSGAKTRRLRLFVIAPTPYRKRKSSRLYYRQPAFLLCVAHLDIQPTSAQFVAVAAA